MKFGAYMYEPKKAEGFEFYLLRVKLKTGTRLPPVQDTYGNIAVFADNVAARSHPEWISHTPLGPTWMGNSNFNIYWDVSALRSRRFELNSWTTLRMLTSPRWVCS